MSNIPPPSETGDDDQSDSRKRRRKQKRTQPGSGLAKISLGISLLLATGGFLYFYIQGEYVTAIGAGVIFVLGGLWEYRRRRQDVASADRYERDAEKRRNQYRK